MGNTLPSRGAWLRDGQDAKCVASVMRVFSVARLLKALTACVDEKQFMLTAQAAGEHGLAKYRRYSSDALLLSAALPCGSCRGARSKNGHVNQGVANNKDSAISHSNSHLRDGDSCDRMILVAGGSLWRSPRSHRDACRIRRRAGSGSNLQKSLQR